jgi:hypothetical protein
VRLERRSVSEAISFLGGVRAVSLAMVDVNLTSLGPAPRSAPPYTTGWRSSSAAHRFEMTNMGGCEPLSDQTGLTVRVGARATWSNPPAALPAVPDELDGEESLVSQWELKR